MRPHLLILLLLAACGGKDDTGDIIDQDGDGFGANADCDDGNAGVRPDGVEQPYDGLDNDCDPSTPDDDLDGDGYIFEQDCDDDDPASYPGGDEYCDGADNDCDGDVDENALDTLAWYADYDSDGYGDPENQTLACEAPPAYVADDSDCNDDDPEIHPGADEPWDGVDNDCDGDIDEEGGAPQFDWYHDGDGDGFGDPYDAVKDKEQPYGYVPNDEDCDDTDDLIYPDADERCNGLDDDCDVQVDEDGACLGLDIAQHYDDWWTGDSSSDAAGYSLAGGVDLTDDGTHDFVIGAPGTSGGGSFYFMPGEYLGYATGIALDLASSSGEITWAKTMSGAELGNDVALFRDIDGDGSADFGAGAPGADGSGLVVIWMSSVEDYSYISLTGGLSEMGGVAPAGDVDNDGLSDVLVGAPGAEFENGDEGMAEIFLGDTSEQLAEGIYFYGHSANDELGSEVGSAGDVDGDGLDDSLLAGRGYPGGDRTGGIWMILGRPVWLGVQADLYDADHFFMGVSEGDHAGHALEGGQDFDSDGYEDFVITAPYADATGSGTGEVYLWRGGALWASSGASWSMASAPTTFVGEDADDRAGYAVELMPDFDGDGAVDLAVGAPYVSTLGSLRGKVYMLSGGIGMWVGSCDLADASVTWLGEDPGDHLGWSLAGGDADADGLSDLLMGAEGADDNGSDSGSIYLVLGW